MCSIPPLPSTQWIWSETHICGSYELSNNHKSLRNKGENGMHVKAIINFQLISFSVWRLRIDDIKDIADETNNSGCLIGVS